MSKKKLHTCIIGLGFFGGGLALSLSEHAEVLVIDKDISKINQISDFVNQAVSIDVRDFNALSSVITDNLDDVVISIGEDLEASILCTLHLKKLNVPFIRAKASTEDHAKILRLIGADQVIFPELETAQRLALKILNPQIVDLVTYSEGYAIGDIMVPESFHFHSLSELQIRNKYNTLVIAIKKNKEEIHTFLPKPDYIIKPGDILEIIGKEEDLLGMRNIS